ncbi:alpha/beta fold hydrolase [Chryseobacterium sp. W4I1]|uniref:alpha/beta fold hydrolase n=1 Tax=Chryseobacterium sp. W4I1 TaxID=3042293 RepID=UPI002786AB72|nr:alpha/beta hydrolase [Chryseobacterium sp. W4I1]MDQ0781318.1 pimeloyl-ACP methyl ester carboxylesterase [Chryseobacterium sp. W4I1]
MKIKNLNKKKDLPLIERQLCINEHYFRILEQGEGPAILFLHGFPDTAETWKQQMKSLSDEGYHTIAFDLRGFGGSYAPADYKLYSGQHIVSDITDILDYLDVESAVLVGHDWGADHTQKAILLCPDRFKGLVSLSIPFFTRAEMSQWDALRKNGLGKKYYALEMMQHELEEDYLPAEKTIKNVFYWLSASPASGTGWDPIDETRNMFRSSPIEIPEWTTKEYIEKTVGWFEKTGFQTGINHYRANQITFDETSSLKGKKIEHPSLYIWGREDGLCKFFHPEVPTLEELQKNHPGLIKQVALKNVGHWPQHEAAETVNNEILAFLHEIDFK